MANAVLSTFFATLKHLPKCSKLMVLKVGLCSSLTNEVVAYIGQSCINLQDLDLYHCTGVNDDGLGSLATGCKKLKKLNVCYCNEISDQGMKHPSSLKELSDLEIRELHRVTGLGITAIALGCNSITELDMKQCYSIDVVALCALTQYSPNIRQINVSYCPVSAVGLWKLLGNLRCLQDAKLVHLTKVSVDGFELAWRASYGRLKKLKMIKGLKNSLSPGLLQMLQARNYRLCWVDKPLKPFPLGQ